MEFLPFLTVPHVVSPAPAVDWCAGATSLDSSLHTSVHAVEAARDGWLRALAMTGRRASTHTAHIAQWRVTTWRTRFALRVGIAGIKTPPRRQADSDKLKTLETPPSVEGSTGQRDNNGSGEIRTHGTLARTHTFQACALNHSATDPTLRGPAEARQRQARRRRSADPARGRLQRTATRERPTDRVRFELTIPLRVRRFSRPVLSTTQPPVRSSR